MKDKKKKTKIIIIIIIFLIILILLLVKNDLNIFKDDLIFFKNFYTAQDNNETNIETRLEKETNNRNYKNANNILKISTKKSDKKGMYLFSNISNDTSWNKIIYPGTKGEFSIQIYGQENLNYQIIFQSKNEKPKNLVFNEKGRDDYYETLENLGETLNGNINKGEVKEIVIEWQWKYETNEKGDKQDTIDGNQLKEYNFEIIAKGKEKT